MKQGFLILTFLLFVSTNAFCQFFESDITITTKGLSDEYASRFKENVNIFTETLNQLSVPSSIKPIKMEVIYENGEEYVLVTINYNHSEIFSDYSTYTSLTKQWSGFSKGISIYLQEQIFTALSSYKKSVATKGYMMDKDLLKFESATKLKKQNGDWMIFYAYNYLDSRGFYPHITYKNVHMQISGKTYETETGNTKMLSDMKYFAVGKTTGLDGNKTGAYYFCKFFNIETE